jgi:hypothetical protein
MRSTLAPTNLLRLCSLSDYPGDKHSGYCRRPYHNIVGDHSKRYRWIAPSCPFPVSVIHVLAILFPSSSWKRVFWIYLSSYHVKGNNDFSLKCSKSRQLWFLF